MVAGWSERSCRSCYFLFLGNHQSLSTAWRLAAEEQLGNVEHLNEVPEYVLSWVANTSQATEEFSFAPFPGFKQLRIVSTAKLCLLQKNFE